MHGIEDHIQNATKCGLGPFDVIQTDNSKCNCGNNRVGYPVKQFGRQEQWCFTNCDGKAFAQYFKWVRNCKLPNKPKYC